MKDDNNKSNIYDSYDLEQDERKEAKKVSRSTNIVKWMWISFLGLGGVIALLMLLIYNGVIGYMPPIEELEDPHDQLASVLYASDGTTQIGRFYEGAGVRISSDNAPVSQNVINALIATEDIRFNEHSGIDFMALGRTAVKTLMLRDKSSGGGSTITQQLAKQLYSQPSQNFFKRAMQKPIEWMIAIKLERFYTKEEILQMYLNRFDFLNNAVGIKTASEVYFGKEPIDLTTAEAAMLIGMLKNPSYYNPRRHPERTRERRNVVLSQMVKAGFLSDADANIIKEQPLGLNFHKIERPQGTAPYLREEIRHLMLAKKPVKPSRSDYKTDLAYKLAYGQYNTDSVEWEENPLYGWIEKNPKPDGSFYDLYTDGLRIYTTIDVKMQEYAEEAVYQHLGGTLQPAFFAEKRGSRNGPYTSNTAELSSKGVQNLIDNAIRQTERYRIMKNAGASDDEINRAFNTPYTMDVFAYVQKDGKWRPGSKTVTMTPRDSMLYMKSILRTGVMSMEPNTGYVKAYVGGPDFTYFQYDMVSTGKRQIGSTAKPFLYSLAMESGYTPDSQILNTQPVFGNWAPRGSGGRAGQMVDLQWALTNSSNWISVKLCNELGPANLANKMRMFGLTGYIEPTLPLSLGSVDMRVKEMVAGFTAFANKGLRVNPIFVTKIEDNSGNVIYSSNPHRAEVLNEEAYCNILSMLMSVVNNGTGRAIRSSYNITVEMGGKTGTTNSNSDAWFIGFTPELVTGVWVGGEERYIHFVNSGIGQGARAALPIFGLYTRNVLNDPKLPYSSDAKFDIPEIYKPAYQFAEAPVESAETTEETVEGVFE